MGSCRGTWPAYAPTVTGSFVGETAGRHALLVQRLTMPLLYITVCPFTCIYVCFLFLDSSYIATPLHLLRVNFKQ
jgi:hypothetical protein